MHNNATKKCYPLRIFNDSPKCQFASSTSAEKGNLFSTQPFIILVFVWIERQLIKKFTFVSSDRVDSLQTLVVLIVDRCYSGGMLRITRLSPAISTVLHRIRGEAVALRCYISLSADVDPQSLVVEAVRLTIWKVILQPTCHSKSSYLQVHQYSRQKESRRQMDAQKNEISTRRVEICEVRCSSERSLVFLKLNEKVEVEHPVTIVFSRTPTILQRWSLT